MNHQKAEKIEKILLPLCHFSLYFPPISSNTLKGVKITHN